MELRNYLQSSLLIATIFLSSCSIFSVEETIKITPLAKIENQFIPKTRWITSVGNGIGDFYSNLHPAWQNGTVYAADRFGIVKALNASNGKTKWKIDLSEKHGFFLKPISALLSGGITINDDCIYIGSERGQVYALNTLDGSIVWQSKVIGEVLSRPVVSDGVVLIHTGNGIIQGLNQSNGAIKWSVNLGVPPLSLRGESAPAVAFGGAIVGDDNGRISALTVKQGQLIWQQYISHPRSNMDNYLNDVDITPVIINDVAYVLAYNGDLTKLDLRSGQILWNRKIGSVKNLVINSNRIYVVDQDDRIISLYTDGSKIIWSQNKLLHRHLTSPVLLNSYLIVGDNEGYIHWINSFDGHFLAQKKFDRSGFQSEPLVANDTLIIQSNNGKVYAITS